MNIFNSIADFFTRIADRDNLLVIAETILFIIVAFIVLKLVIFTVKRIIRKRVAQQASMLIIKAINYIGFIIILLVVLYELGINLGIILGTAGVAGIAVGFASQTSLSNFISGLFIIAEKAFEIGDVIKVGGLSGTVVSIDMLAVKLNTFDNRYVRVPNEVLIKSELINVSRYPIRRLDFDIYVSYKDDLDFVEQTLLSVAKENTFCLDNPEPFFLIKNYGERGVEIQLGAWFSKTDYICTRNQMMKQIKLRFEEVGIEIPLQGIRIYSD